MPTLEERVNKLEGTVKTFVDQEGILRTMYQYSHCMDRGRTAAEFIDCFVETGVWRSTPVTNTGGAKGDTVSGHKALAEWFTRMGREDPKWWNEDHLMTAHNQTMPDIRIEGDRATGETYFLGAGEALDGPRLSSIGRYLDKFVRCPDGRWRFEERHLEREGTAPMIRVRRITNFNREEEEASRAVIRAEREIMLAQRAAVLAQRNRDEVFVRNHKMRDDAEK